jgi:hypothetical protein
MGDELFSLSVGQGVARGLVSCLVPLHLLEKAGVWRAESVNKHSFSFSVRHTPTVKLYLGIDERPRVTVYTNVPDKWYTDDDPKRRKALRTKLWAAFPKPPDKDSDPRWPAWKFDVPRDEGSMIDLIAALGEALVTVVSPESPHSYEV